MAAGEWRREIVVEHVQVENHYIRFQFHHLLKSFRKRCGFAHNFDVFPLAQQAADCAAHNFCVVRQKHPDAHTTSIRELGTWGTEL